MKPIIYFFTILCIQMLSGVSANAVTYHVSPSGSDDNPGTEARPFQTLDYSTSVLRSGDTLYMMNGNYDVGTGAMNIHASGTADNWVKIHNFPGHTPRIIGKGWNVVRVAGDRDNPPAPSSYVEVRGLTIVCDDDAEDFNIFCNGFEFGYGSHDIRIIGNTVLNAPRSAIGMIEVDRFHVEGNWVRNSAWGWLASNPDVSYGTSAISVYKPRLHSASDDYGFVIRNNVADYNYNSQPFFGTGTLSDGNCIILDDFDSASTGPYRGNVLIENNVCFNNGGRAVHIFDTSNHNEITIRNNTGYFNGFNSDTEGEIVMHATANNVEIYNNIMYAREGKAATDGWADSGINWHHNLIYGTDIIRRPGDNDIVGQDPLFQNAAITAEEADFSLLDTSPAIGAGVNCPETDIMGQVRTSCDIGAFAKDSRAPVQLAGAGSRFAVGFNPTPRPKIITNVAAPSETPQPVVQPQREVVEIDGWHGTGSEGVRMFFNWGVAWFNPGKWVSYDTARWRGANSISLSYASVADAVVEVRANHPQGDVVATLNLPSNNSWNSFQQSESFDLGNLDNVNVVYLFMKTSSVNYSKIHLQ